MQERDKNVRGRFAESLNSLYICKPSYSHVDKGIREAATKEGVRDVQVDLLSRHTRYIFVNQVTAK